MQLAIHVSLQDRDDHIHAAGQAARLLQRVYQLGEALGHVATQLDITEITHESDPRRKMGRSQGRGDVAQGILGPVSAVLGACACAAGGAVNAHSGHRLSDCRSARLAQNAPVDVRAHLFAPHCAAGASLDFRAPLGRNLPASAKPLADGGLRDLEGSSHGGLAPKVRDGARNCIHAENYKHCECSKQAHCLLQAMPVEIPTMKIKADLGEALHEAMSLKGVKQDEVAKAFGVKQPSVSQWIKHGRIGKKHLVFLFKYFSDCVKPEHWGLPPGFTTDADALDGKFSAGAREIAAAFEHLDGDEQKQAALNHVLSMLKANAYDKSIAASNAANGTTGKSAPTDPAPTFPKLPPEKQA